MSYEKNDGKAVPIQTTEPQIIPDQKLVKQQDKKRTLQQLMLILKNPTNPEQQEQILSLLRSNPQLMAAFIKQRQASQRIRNATAGGNIPLGHLQQQPQGMFGMGSPNDGQIIQPAANTDATAPGSIQNVNTAQRGVIPDQKLDKKRTLQQLMLILKNPTNPEQQEQILSLLRSNPQLMAAFIKQRQASQRIQNATAGGNVPLGHLQRQPQGMFGMGSPNDGQIIQPPANTDATVPGSIQYGNTAQRGVIPDQKLDTKHKLQQLMLILKNPTNQEQQDQILSLLKSNPQLMAAFIKQRQASQQNQNAAA